MLIHAHLHTTCNDINTICVSLKSIVIWSSSVMHMSPKWPDNSERYSDMFIDYSHVWWGWVLVLKQEKGSVYYTTATIKALWLKSAVFKCAQWLGIKVQDSPANWVWIYFGILGCVCVCVRERERVCVLITICSFFCRCFYVVCIIFYFPITCLRKINALTQGFNVPLTFWNGFSNQT